MPHVVGTVEQEKELLLANLSDLRTAFDDLFSSIDHFRYVCSNLADSQSSTADTSAKLGLIDE